MDNNIKNITYKRYEYKKILQNDHILIEGIGGDNTKYKQPLAI